MQSPVTPRQHWISDLCRRLGQAIDCPLQYVPAAERVASVESIPWEAPIFDGREVAGLLRLDPECESPGPAHLGVVHELGDLFAQLISQVAQADRRLELHSQDVSTLLEMGRQLRQPDLKASLEALLRAAAQLTRTWTTAFFLLDPTAGELRLRAAWQLGPADVPRPRRALGSGAPDWLALRNGMAILDRTIPGDDRWLPEQVQAGLVIPVELHGTPIGTLWCFERRRRPLAELERSALAHVAEQLAALLDRTLLLKDRTARRRFASELRQAGLLQHGTVDRGFEADVRLDVAVRTRPAGDLGGDLCELFPRSSSEVFFAVGDAVGHSLPSAMIMSMARGVVHGLLPDLGSHVTLPQLLGRINAGLFRVTQAEQFMTMVCGVLDLDTLVLEYSNAGHPSPFLIRSGQGAALDSHGLLLGVLPDARYSSSRLQLEPGDLLLFYTDGVTDAVSRSRQSFRTSGLLQAALKAMPVAESIAESVWQALTNHGIDSPAAADDQTLLVVRIPTRA